MGTGEQIFKRQGDKVKKKEVWLLGWKKKEMFSAAKSEQEFIYHCYTKLGHWKLSKNASLDTTVEESDRGSLN